MTIDYLAERNLIGISNVSLAFYASSSIEELHILVC